MHMILYFIAYLALGVFAIAVLVRIINCSKMPLHLRWELYPVAHEAKKAHYGGSYLEESEWWKKPREVSLWGELKVMIPEILFLLALREHNRKLWSRSFFFHFGLYLIISSTGIMILTGILSVVWPDSVIGGFGVFLHYIKLIFGATGLFLAIIGALGLLHRRLTDPDLKNYSSASDIFNLIIFVVVFGGVLTSFLLVDRDLSRTQLFISNLVSGNLSPISGSGVEVVLLGISVVFMSLLLGYIPLTHMSHFIGKYFAYHAVRWNDSPNLPGGKEEKTISRLLSQPISWAAPHIKGDGRKSWADAATDLGQKETEE